MTKSTSKWLNAYSDNEMLMMTIPSCLALADLKNENYYKLITADIPYDSTSRTKLKVFKGTGLQSEQGLPGVPSSIKCFYIDEPEPKIPIIAVSIGPSVLFYRNLKPYYKFTVPSMTVNPLEFDVWRKLPIEKHENQIALIESLRSIEYSSLTTTSKLLLQLKSPEEIDDYVKNNAEVQLQRLSPINVMTTLQRTSSDLSPPSCLIIGTENGDILIIDTIGFTIIHRARISATPNLISVLGQFDTDFRVVIASRECSIFILRKSWLEGKEITRINGQAIGLILLPVDQTIVAAGMTNRLTCYSKKGRQLWSTHLEESPQCITPVHLPHLGMTLVAIALKGGIVRLYSQKIIVDEFELETSVQAMIFGQLGQEEHCLNLFLKNGSLLVKILKRTAEFDPEGIRKNQKVEEQIKTEDFLVIPKKSMMFLEKAKKDRMNAKSIYCNIQVELWRLRLSAARATVEALDSSETTISGDLNTASIKVAAEICGFGPKFQLFLVIENMSANKEATNLNVILHSDNLHYNLPKAFAKLPTLIPGSPLRIDFEIMAVLDANDGLPPTTLTPENSIVRVLIFKDGQTKPLIAAIVSIPESEAPLEN